jgi:hypothetical protein
MKYASKKAVYSGSPRLSFLSWIPNFGSNDVSYPDIICFMEYLEDRFLELYSSLPLLSYGLYLMIAQCNFGSMLIEL